PRDRDHSPSFQGCCRGALLARNRSPHISGRRTAVRTTYAAFAGAIGVNAILPARVGEALRLGMMRRRIRGSSVATIGGTMVLETGIEATFGLVVVAAVLLSGRSIGPLGSPV